MRYKLLGRSGLRVSELCLGTMTFGTEWGWGADKKEAEKIFQTYVEAGGNFIDTANLYTDGSSERMVGEFIGRGRDYFVVSTKYTLAVDKDDVNACGNHRKNMVQSLESSLRRLKTDYIDVFWLHAWDFTTRVDEVMRAIDDLVSQGKILYAGVSNTPAWVISKANTMANLRGWTPFTALQVEYNLVERSAERDIFPMARHLDIAICPWGILAAGVLTGKYEKAKDSNAGLRLQNRPITEREHRIAQEAISICDECGCDPVHVAINWVRQRKQVVSPVVGARTAEQLKQNLGCLDFQLQPEQIERLEKAAHIDLGFPHDFLKKESVREMVYGRKHVYIDGHRRLI